jgi:PadR family transcriptional regulator PadR
MNIQIKKGVLELCVLAMLQKQDRYGFELVTEISKTIDMADGTIYPLLKRLKDDGLVTTYLIESQEGPPRKYYRITRAGVRIFEENLREWFEFSETVNIFLKEASGS